MMKKEVVFIKVNKRKKGLSKLGLGNPFFEFDIIYLHQI